MHLVVAQSRILVVAGILVAVGGSPTAAVGSLVVAVVDKIPVAVDFVRNLVAVDLENIREKNQRNNFD